MNAVEASRLSGYVLFAAFCFLAVWYSSGSLLVVFVTSLVVLAGAALVYSYAVRSSRAQSTAWGILGVASISASALTPSSNGVVILFAWTTAFVASADFAEFTWRLVPLEALNSSIPKEQLADLCRLVSLKVRRLLLTASATFLFSLATSQLVPGVVLPNAAAGTALFAGAVLVVLFLISFDWLSGRPNLVQGAYARKGDGKD